MPSSLPSNADRFFFFLKGALCVCAGQLAGRKGAIVANANLVKVAIHKGLKHYMLAPLPRGKGAKKRAELGLTVSRFPHAVMYSTGAAMLVSVYSIALAASGSMFNWPASAVLCLSLHDDVCTAYRMCSHIHPTCSPSCLSH